MALPKSAKVRVICPKNLRGKVGYIDGDPLKIPSQSIWLTPVVIDGKSELVRSYAEWTPPLKPEFRGLDDPWGG